MESQLSKIAVITLKGASGLSYEFDVYPLQAEGLPLGAVYYISTRTVQTLNKGSHSSHYFGQTCDSSRYLEDHDLKY